ncbi:hypothetical protein CELL_01606 [Cellulomonas sp. T2.31MG-18]|uniref:hypothetical protein n=1 Tax=Cellulomonas sp. T2.31MG-18 TaxID=3157619 RepID=UPI0035E91110
MSTLRRMTTESEASRTTLNLNEGGLWAIKSSSPSVIYLDLKKKMLLRVPGPGSPAWEYDGVWVPLAAVEDHGGPVEEVTVGVRHVYLTDPDGGSRPYQWWSPRACTSIEPVQRDTLPTLDSRARPR